MTRSSNNCANQVDAFRSTTRALSEREAMLQLNGADRRYKVLHVLQPDHGGVPGVVADYATHQQSVGFDVAVAGPVQLLHKLRDTEYELFAWDAERLPGASTVREWRSLRRIVTSFQPDVVHLHSSKAGLVGRLGHVAPRAVRVFQPHAWSFQVRESRFARASVFWERYASSRADLIICVSESEKKVAVNRKVGGRTAIVPNGVNAEQFHPQSRRDARIALGLNADDLIVACVGRLSKQKGQDVLLAQWAEVSARLPSAKLVLVGKGIGALVSLGLDGRFVLFDQHDDPRPFYAAADVVAIPSRWEGMALVPLEAMASARSIVAFDVEGMSETVGKAGNPLASRGDIGEFTRLLIGLLEDKQSRLLAESRNRAYATTRLNLSTSNAEVERLYRNLLRDRSERG